jgi:hypothetical protein
MKEKITLPLTFKSNSNIRRIPMMQFEKKDKY